MQYRSDMQTTTTRYAATTAAKAQEMENQVKAAIETAGIKKVKTYISGYGDDSRLALWYTADSVEQIKAARKQVAELFPAMLSAPIKSNGYKYFWVGGGPTGRKDLMSLRLVQAVRVVS